MATNGLSTDYDDKDTENSMLPEMTVKFSLTPVKSTLHNLNTLTAGISNRRTTGCARLSWRVKKSYRCLFETSVYTDFCNSSNSRELTNYDAVAIAFQDVI